MPFKGAGKDSSTEGRMLLRMSFSKPVWKEGQSFSETHVNQPREYSGVCSTSEESKRLAPSQSALDILHKSTRCSTSNSSWSFRAAEWLRKLGAFAALSRWKRSRTTVTRFLGLRRLGIVTCGSSSSKKLVWSQQLNSMPPSKPVPWCASWLRRRRRQPAHRRSSRRSLDLAGSVSCGSCRRSFLRRCISSLSSPFTRVLSRSQTQGARVPLSRSGLVTPALACDCSSEQAMGTPTLGRHPEAFESGAASSSILEICSCTLASGISSTASMSASSSFSSSSPASFKPSKPARLIILPKESLVLPECSDCVLPLPPKHQRSTFKEFDRPKSWTRRSLASRTCGWGRARIWWHK
mmetsp:Transcript_110620/g.308158  ORF Transcript_110620/g.308158 Transcript_110620/m.308158 type:complete len:352 (-) Transcript_110620:1312-2367(-)